MSYIECDWALSYSNSSSYIHGKYMYMRGTLFSWKATNHESCNCSLRILLCICTLKCSTRWCLKELLSMGTKHCNPLPIRDSTSMSREKHACMRKYPKLTTFVYVNQFVLQNIVTAVNNCWLILFLPIFYLLWKSLFKFCEDFYYFYNFCDFFLLVLINRLIKL